MILFFMTDFNSTLVRLKANVGVLIPEITFDFNSTLVRLKAPIFWSMIRCIQISIPLWFD